MMEVTLKDPSLPATLFMKIFQDDSHKNVHFSTCDGTLVLAHSCVLSAASPKLRDIFGQNSFGFFQIDTPNITCKTWELVLEFLYTGSTNLPLGFNVEKLYQMSNALQLEPLQKFFQENPGIVTTPGASSASAGASRAPQNTALRHSLAGTPHSVISIAPEDNSNVITIGANVNSSFVSPPSEFRPVHISPVSSAPILGTVRPAVVPVRTLRRGTSPATSAPPLSRASSKGRAASESLVTSSSAGPATNDGSGRPDVEAGDDDMEVTGRRKRQLCVKSKASAAKGMSLRQAKERHRELPPPQPLQPAECSDDENNEMMDAGGCSAPEHYESDDSSDPQKAVRSCDPCGKVFQTTEHAALHFRSVHSDVYGYKCGNCAAAFMSRQELKEHCEKQCGNEEEEEDEEETHEGEASDEMPCNIECPTCGKKFPNKRGVHKHVLHCRMASLIDINIVAKVDCDECGVTFAKPGLAARHFIAEHNDFRGYKCIICGDGFEDEANLRLHSVSRHKASPVTDHKTQIGARKAGKKKRVFTSMRGLRKQCCHCFKFFPKHVFSSHIASCNRLSPPSGEFQLFECVDCNLKFARFIDAVNHFEQVQHQKNGYICRFCTAGFSNRMSLVYHFMTSNECNSKHKSLKDSTQMAGKNGKLLKTSKEVKSDDKQDESPDSKKTTSNKGQTRGYMLTKVISEDEFQCLKCKKIFRRKGICHAETCGRNISIQQIGKKDGHICKENLHRQRKHMMDLTCKECGQRSHNLSQASKHLATVHNVKARFVCKYCNHGYESYQGLYVHFQICSLHFGNNEVNSEKEYSEDVSRPPKRKMEAVSALPNIGKKKKMSYENEAVENLKLDIARLECHVCGHLSASDEDAVEHLNGTHLLVDGCYVCRKCNMQHNSYIELAEHAKDCGERKRSSQRGKRASIPFFEDCDLCSFKASSVQDMANHMKNKHGNRSYYICGNCNKECDSYSRLQHHIKKGCQSSPILCKSETSEDVIVVIDSDEDTEIDTTMTAADRVKQEKDVEETDSTAIAATTSMAAAVNDDIIDVIVIDDDDDDDDGDAMLPEHCEKMVSRTCQQCGHVSDNAKDSATHLIAVHQVINCFVCRVCSSAYARYSEFCRHAPACKAHEEECNVSNYMLFSCTKCPTMYPAGDIVGLAKHYEVVHESGQGLVCKTCETGFMAQKSFKYHLATQPCGGMVFGPSVVNQLICPDCDYVAEKHPDLRQHLDQAHQSRSSYICCQCKETFSLQHDLLIHARWNTLCRRRFLMFHHN